MAVRAAARGGRAENRVILGHRGPSGSAVMATVALGGGGLMGCALGLSIDCGVGAVVAARTLGSRAGMAHGGRRKGDEIQVTCIT